MVVSILALGLQKLYSNSYSAQTLCVTLGKSFHTSLPQFPICVMETKLAS